MGRDPREKLLIFSDGLDVDTIIKTYRHLEGRVCMSFGWGTNLTNDFAGCAPTEISGLNPISIVCKVSEANGRPAVKLSDNPRKVIGTVNSAEFFLTVTISAAFIYHLGVADLAQQRDRERLVRRRLFCRSDH